MAMDSSSSRIVLSGPVKVGLAIMGAVVLLVEAYFFHQDSGAMLIILIGTLAVAALLVAYATFLQWSNKRRAVPLEKGVLANTAASPYRVSEPARRAALDELRKKFEAGVAKFRAAGKDLYSLPWYVIVGEPGGGKTEAIRHCNVGFPPGLQDYTQGAGGTINMNWWFTNHAIILDTAGRMMFEEVVPGSTNEWEQFLKLLVKSRPNCPVNGLLLVIPADSLVRDSADVIEKKAAKIAQQLDHIQRTLSVRFPVFVVVTKCDLINGFREFFDDLTDPQLQHQVLGWSNPSPLDEAFNPEMVDQHLRTVRERLIRRRQALMLDPVHTEDPSGRRVDQVDALYAFPDAFLKIAPRLRRYLEMIFVAGEWSPKPLFLRGIYFTSSMREGTALDAELAEALQVPVESLRDDGRSWERERAYFLRDLFMIKVFREKGLVTRASNTQRVQRRRKLVLMTLALFGVAILLVTTWTGAKKLDENIGQQTRYWMSVNANWNDRRNEWSLVQPVAGSNTYRYNGQSEINLGESHTSLGQFFTDASQRAQDRINVPWVFRAQVMIQGDLNDKRRKAYRRLYEASMLCPVIDACRERIRVTATGDAPAWSTDATDAVAELVRLELYAGGVQPPARPDQSLLNLDPMMRFILSEDEYASFKSEDRKAIQDAIEWLYADSSSSPDWPPITLGATSPPARKALEEGVKGLQRYWTARLEGANPRLADIRAVRQSLDHLAQTEDALLRAGGATGATGEAYEGLKRNYLAQLEKFNQSAANVDQAVAKLEKSVPAGQSLLALYEIEVDRDIEAALRNHEKLIQQIPKPAAPGAENKTPDYLLALRQSLSDALARIPKLRTVALPEDLQNDLSRIDRQYLTRLKGLDGKERRQYQVHAQVFQAIGKQFAPPATTATTPGGLESFRAAAEALDRQTADLTTHIAALPGDAGTGGERLQQVCVLGKSLAEAAARQQRYRLVDSALTGVPADAAAFAAKVRAAAATAQPTLKFPAIIVAKQAGGDDVPPEYRPQAARAVLSGWLTLGGYLEPSGGGGPQNAGDRILERDKLLARYQATRDPALQYATAYCKYWNDQLPARLKVSIEKWNEFFRDGENPRTWKAWEANKAIKELIQMAATALGEVDEALPMWRQQLKAGAARDRYQAVLAQLDETLFQRECDKVLLNWRSLARDAGYDPAAARALVLEMKPDAWRDQFLFAGSAADGIAVQYWSDVAFELTRSLRVAASGGSKTLNESVGALRAFDRFPLAPLRAGQLPLARNELAAARKLRDKIVTLRRPMTAPSSLGLAIANDGTREYGRFNEELKQLRGQDLPEPDARWLERLGKVMDALPATADGTLECTVWVASGDDQRGRAARTRPPDWYSVTLSQGGAAAAAGQEVQIFPLRETREKLGLCRAPGGAIEFGFYKNPSHVGQNPNIGYVPPGGEWQVLGLLHDRGARPLGDSKGRRWYVEVPLPSRSDRIVGLILEFDREIPRLEDWPAAPPKAAPPNDATPAAHRPDPGKG
ncbi:MAG TPA: type VI secretion protein IcmF/TssM N-terminal domain-containing protein [Tepidisphaeraceae bacterium]